MEQFTFVKRGYDPEEVDKYITTLEQVIKSYKDKDNAIKNAIISAQVAADNVVKNAQAQADAYKLQIADQLEDMRNTLDLNRRRLKAFDEAYTSMVGRFMRELDMSDMAELVGKIEEMEVAIADLQGLEVVSGGKEEYLDQEQTSIGNRGRGEYRENLPAPAPGGFIENRPPMRDFDDPAPRDIVDPRDLDRDFPREHAHYAPQEPDFREPVRERDMRPAARDMRLPAFQDRDVREFPELPPAHEQREIREPAREMRPAREAMMPPPDQFREQPRELPPRDREPQPREMMRPPSHEMREPAPAPREMRREPSRDIRRDAPRDIRREPMARDIMRDNPPPMREQARNFMPEPDGYGDDESNLLPPVASLM